MKYDPARHQRRSIRLTGYDYSQAGAYSITICAQGRECLFGEVVDGEMRLNAAGRMIESVWNDMPSFYPGIVTDAFVVMPNHIHGIVIIVGATAGDAVRAAPCGRPDNATVGADPRVCPESGQPRGVAPTSPSGQPRGVAPTSPSGQPRGVAPTSPSGQPRGVAPTLSLPDVVHRFKTMTTKRYADGVKQMGWPPFPGRLWQRNYYEHIIRDDESLNRIREYIANNPLHWGSDQENQ